MWTTPALLTADLDPKRWTREGARCGPRVSPSLPYGFRGVLDLNYLSSLTFREAFTQTYIEAANSEVHTTGFVTKRFDSYSLNAIISRFENFQSVSPGDRVKIRHLPQLEFNSVDRPNLGQRSAVVILAELARQREPLRSASPIRAGRPNRRTRANGICSETLPSAAVERVSSYPRR